MRGSSPRMTIERLSPPTSDHLRRADFLPNPARAGEQPVVVIALSDQLNTDRKIVRPAMGRQRHARRMQRRPDRLHGAVAGRSEAFRRFAVHAWRQQYIEPFEHRWQERAAFLDAAPTGDVILTRGFLPVLD